MSAALQLRYQDVRTRDSTTPIAKSASTSRSARLWSHVPPEYLRDLSASRHPFSGFEDSLTGLANRLAAQAVIDGLISRGKQFGLVLIDLDGFKEVNDTFGHDAGDSLLRHVAAYLASSDDERLVARLGGDEFILIVPGVRTRNSLMRLASSVCEGLKCEVADCFTGAVQASAGAVLFPMHATDRQNLLKRADIALYEAKRAGRDRAKVFGASMQARVERRAQAITQAHQCLKDGARLRTYFQPKNDLASGRTTGFEALLRCTDQAGSFRSPSWLTAGLEESSVAIAIGQIVLQQSLDFLEMMHNVRNARTSVAINVTAHELRRPGWASDFIYRIRRADVRPSAIEVEIHECALLEGAGSATMRAIRMLHDFGIRISLDDFGTGFASLAHLRCCPVDALKIDRSFIRNLCDPEDQAIVRAVIDLAQALGMGVVAEGVETREQHEILKAWGCPEGQGFYYGRPTRAERCLDRLQ